MIMFRIPIAQPPKATRKSAERAGSGAKSSQRTQATTWLNSEVNAPETGRDSRVVAKIHARTMPSHIYGVAVRTYPTGNTVLSSAFCGCHSPTLFPAQKLSRTAGTSSESV